MKYIRDTNSFCRSISICFFIKVKTICRLYSIHLVLSTWTQDANWTYRKRLEDVQDVFWTSCVRSVYILCPGVQGALFNFKYQRNISFGLLHLPKAKWDFTRSSKVKISIKTRDRISISRLNIWSADQSLVMATIMATTTFKNKENYLPCKLQA